MISRDPDAARRLILPMPGNETLAGNLARAGGWDLGRLEIRAFPDGESYVRLAADVAGRTVYLVCTLADPDPQFLRLLFAADAARSQGARAIVLIAPYLAYMRQDRSFKAGEAISSRTFARLLSAGFDRLVTVDPHLHRYSALSALYDIPADTLHAAPLLADWIAARVDEPLLIGPDQESEQWVSAIAARIGAPHAVLSKVRRGDRSVEIKLPDLSRWQARRPVLVDDIVSSGHTLVEAARLLSAQGLPLPTCVVVHGLFAADAYARLAAVTDRIVSSDAVPHQSSAISLVPLLASAIAGAAAAGSATEGQRRG
jgi:ribose-phosphate pyrophosphokinase